MNDDGSKILCKTPTPGKQGVRILKWKYDLVREAILDVVPMDKVGVPFMQLPDLIKRRLSEDEFQRLGSVNWHTTTVKLDLEVRGEIERVPGATPQHLRRTR